MSDLRTTVAGIQFDNPLLNAAGCWDTDKQQLDALMESHAGGVVTKSGTIRSKEGNKLPRLYIDELGTSINSIGFANPGVDFYNSYKHYRQNPLNGKPYIRSIFADNGDDLRLILEKWPYLESGPVEFDIGCPNLPKSKSLNWELYERLLDTFTIEQQINQKLTYLRWGVKLPPLFYLNDIAAMANLIRKSSASFITTCNTIPNGLLVNLQQGTTRIAPNNGRGGIGGALVKPIGLANVQQFYSEFKSGRQIDIIGCGGITNAYDVMEYIISGARAVQIGTHLLQYGPTVFAGIEDQLTRIIPRLTHVKSNKLVDFIGTLQVHHAML